MGDSLSHLDDLLPVGHGLPHGLSQVLSLTRAVKVFCCLRVWTDYADFESVDNLLNLKITGDLLFYRE